MEKTAVATRTIPTLDASGRLPDKQLPSRLSSVQMDATIRSTIAQMLAGGNHAGVTFTYNSATSAISVTVNP